MSRGVQTCQVTRRCPDLPGDQEVSRLARGIGVQRCPDLPGGQEVSRLARGIGVQRCLRLARWPGGV